MLRIGSTVIEDPEVLDAARRFIKSRLLSPLKPAKGGEDGTSWLVRDIAVLKLVVELINRGDRPIYYMTNAFCEVCHNETCKTFTPIAWRVESPVALPKIVAEEGDVFPLAVSCTLDLRYRKVSPGASVASEFYYIVAKPFRGTVWAAATICSGPLSSDCRTLEGHLRIAVGGAGTSPLPRPEMSIAEAVDRYIAYRSFEKALGLLETHSLAKTCDGRVELFIVKHRADSREVLKGYVYNVLNKTITLPCWRYLEIRFMDRNGAEVCKPVVFVAPGRCSQIGGIRIEPHTIHILRIGVNPAEMCREAELLNITLRYVYRNATYQLTLELPLNSVRPTLKPWIINSYGDLVVIKINRALFRDAGDGYWVVVLPGIKYNEFDDAALNQVAPYLHIKSPKAVLHALRSGGSYIIKVKATKEDLKNLVEGIVRDLLREAASEGLRPIALKLFLENNSTYVFIGRSSRLDIDRFAKLAYQHFKGLTRKVVVMESLGWLPPGGPYQRIEMINALSNIPCFFSLGESIYGTSMVFNVTCIEELANNSNRSLDDVVEHIVNAVKRINPLIRKYLPWQEVLVIVAETPRLVKPA
ncbi:MAG: hypothetical protein DRO39_02300 [Thermoprotei archaeon]|nr:MAG: hypothetical protein DRO39_02300 [Thermoprotei archaeon]